MIDTNIYFRISRKSKLRNILIKKDLLLFKPVK